MSLFYCTFPDFVSLLVDAEDEHAAREIASDVAEGRAPRMIRALPPRAFVAEVEEVESEPEDDDGEPSAIPDVFWDVTPLEHTEAIFAAYENADDEEPEPCGEVNRIVEQDGAAIEFACVKAAWHTDAVDPETRKHLGYDASGAAYEW